MDTQINPEIIINDLLEQNKQLTFQIAMLKAALAQAQAQAADVEVKPEVAAKKAK